MVQARNSRPKRRNRNAGPARTHAARAPPPLPDAAEPLDPVQYPNLAAQREQDRLQHVRLARQAGLTRKQASEHADEHLGES